MSVSRVNQRPGQDIGAILSFLKKIHRRQQIQCYSALFGGAVVSLLGPMCVTLFYLMFSMTLIASYGFWKSYWLIAAVTLPIFFLMAYFLKGSVLERWVPDGDTLSGRFMRRIIAPTLVILEIANTGPRLVLWGVDRIRGQRRVRGTSPARVAKCLALLAGTDSGVSPAQLLVPGESADRLEPLLGYLLYHQIIDLSKQGDRVWLVSHIRRELVSPGK